MKPAGHEILHRAVAKLGPNAVAQKLEISPASLDRYLSGERSLPESMVLAVIDLVMSEQPKH